jgi:hypothetical protein
VTLKGQCPESLTFGQDYHEKEQSTETDDAVLRPKTKVLLFCVRVAGVRKTEIIFWVNLSKPDVQLSTHAAYNNGCKWLEDSDSVLALVKGRIARENPRDRTTKRGIIVGFTAYHAGDMYWDFVRTADVEYKPELVKQLRDGGKEWAIYNLISYPGKDTRDLIRPFLKDASTSELQVYDGKDASGTAHFKRVRIYRLRQTAYLALNLLGEPTEKPDGYYPDSFMGLFETGFESKAYFPHGDWKRRRRVGATGVPSARVPAAVLALRRAGRRVHLPGTRRCGDDGDGHARRCQGLRGPEEPGPESRQRRGPRQP